MCNIEEVLQDMQALSAFYLTKFVVPDAAVTLFHTLKVIGRIPRNWTCTTV